MTGLSHSPQWIALQAHAKTVSPLHMSELFEADPKRLSWACVDACGFSLDFSKNRMTKETLSLLVDLAKARDLTGWSTRMVSGEIINTTEKRAALHMALRGDLAPAPRVADQNVVSDVAAMKSRMADFVEAIFSGKRLSSTGKPFRHVINIGIGGSDLGPRIVCDALQNHWQGNITPHFVANVDATELVRVLDKVDPETTLIIVASKSFTTQETMTNAETARAWMEAQLPEEVDIGAHFVGVTTNNAAAEAFGISADATFGFWDWVGGRYSVWSSVGLSVRLALGNEGFEAFLSGAAEMDQHFLSAPIEQNLPMLLGLIGVWNHNLLGLSSHVILPYAQSLALFPSYLQQLDMESNGKSTDRAGAVATTDTGPLIWGAAGTNGQHAFYQWLHQGTKIASADIILPLEANHDLGDHHEILTAHAIAQGEALALGRNAEATRIELEAEGLAEAEIERLLPHRIFAGNRPVSTLMMDKLSPRQLGALLALYEHKVFVQGCIWGVNSFDQWGVELGKSLADNVLEAITSDDPTDNILGVFDASTASQIEKARHVRNALCAEDDTT